MSTSPKRAPVVTSEVPVRGPTPFPYAAIPSTASATLFGMAGAADSDSAAAERETQAFARGHQAGQQESRQAFEQQLAKEKSSICAALAEFTRDRATYFEKVEPEVVQLALSIARKILHREAQVDPMLLAGIVRVVLEQIDGATRVQLHVHPQKAADWRQFLAAQLKPASLPEILEDPSQSVDQCTVETTMGSTAVGLDLQLKEIEQGFADLLAARPGAPS